MVRSEHANELAQLLCKRTDLNGRSRLLPYIKSTGLSFTEYSLSVSTTILDVNILMEHEALQELAILNSDFNGKLLMQYGRKHRTRLRKLIMDAITLTEGLPKSKSHRRSLLEFAGVFAELEQLYLNNCHLATSINLDKLIFHNLRYLNLTGCVTIGPALVWQRANFPSLRTLSMPFQFLQAEEPVVLFELDHLQLTGVSRPLDEPSNFIVADVLSFHLKIGYNESLDVGKICKVRPTLRICCTHKSKVVKKLPMGTQFVECCSEVECPFDIVTAKE